MPHVPLKVLRDQQDEEDQNYTVPPGTSTEEEAERAAANNSGTSHSSDEDITTDVGEVSEEGMARYLGRHPGAMHGANQVDDDFCEIQNDQNENAPQYDTIESVNLEAADVQVVAQMYHLPSTSRFDSFDLPSTDVTSNDSEDLGLSNDDRAPLLPKEH